MIIHWRMVYAANSCAYCILRSSTVSTVMAITEAEGKEWGVRENVEYDDDFIGAPVYLNYNFSCMVKLPMDMEQGGQGRGFTGGA
jgi:hypothetical protein